jgi:hypothetical protein
VACELRASERRKDDDEGDADADAAADDLCHALLAAEVEAVLVTGDGTHRSRRLTQ